MRELDDILSGTDEAAERASRAAALLRAAQARVDAMMALAADFSAKAPARDVADAKGAPVPATAAAVVENVAGGEAAIEGVVQPAPEFAEAEAQADDHFARALAALEALSAEPPPPAEPRAGVSATVHEVEAGADVAEAPERAVAGTANEPSPIAFSLLEAFASVRRESEQIEPAAVEREDAPTPAPNDVANILDADVAADDAASAAAAPVIGDSSALREEETQAAPAAEVAASDIEPPPIETAADAARFEEPANEVFSIEEILIEQVSTDVLAGEELWPVESGSEEASGEETSREEGPREEVRSGEVASQESSAERVIPLQVMSEPVEEMPQPPDEDARVAVGSPADDESGGDYGVVAFHDTAKESATVAAEVPSFADDMVSAPEEAPAYPLPPKGQPVGPQEDPGDLFEPLPQPIADVAAQPEESKRPTQTAQVAEAAVNPAGAHAVSITSLSREWEERREQELRTAVSAVVGEASSRVSSGVRPAFSAPPTPAKPDVEQPWPQPKAAAAPIARAIPRLAPSDPLAAVLALSEEELIALFS